MSDIQQSDTFEDDEIDWYDEVPIGQFDRRWMGV